MSETKSEAKAKPKASKAPAAAKPAKAAPAAKAKPAAKAYSNVAEGQIKVTQVVGSIARRHDQEATLNGLGLNKRGRSKVLENTPSVRGMVYKVRHLVKVEKV